MERERAIPWQEAALSWYDNVYQPIVQIIRQQGILAQFPARTEADLYLWIIEHHHYLNERGEASVSEAAERFAREYGQRSWKKLLRGMRYPLEEVVRVRPRPGAQGG